MIERYTGTLYRAINPIYAREPLSGRGAQLYGGRFNPKGVAALYTSLSIMTALREANQVGSLQPTTLVSYEADIERVFDSRDAALLAKYGTDAAALSDPGWRERSRLLGEAPTQTLAQRLIVDGHHGLLTPSFAAGATADDLNLVLWHWGDASPHRLRLIDDDGRLARVQSLT
ncbi:MAG: RES family NAD+ phosphorylase [Devosia sp.]